MISVFLMILSLVCAPPRFVPGYAAGYFRALRSKFRAASRPLGDLVVLLLKKDK